MEPLERNQFDDVKEDVRNALSPLYLEMQELRESVQELSERIASVLELE